ncbi:hypothetical protein KBC03_05900, partial [Patescibacteria group bacterium]|nr:hypothetical protein [Patescibacteria group bacterium]
MKHKTLTITTYMDIWRSLDKTLPVAKQLEYIDSCMDKLTDHDHEEKAKFIAFQGFIGTVNKTIYYLNQRSRNADQEEVQISLMPTESAV